MQVQHMRNLLARAMRNARKAQRDTDTHWMLRDAHAVRLQRYLTASNLLCNSNNVAKTQMYLMRELGCML